MKTLISALFASLLILSASPVHAKAAPIERYTVCVNDTVNGGKVCGRVMLHHADSRQQAEAWSDKTRRHLPKIVRTDARYLGWSKTNASDGINVWSVKSKRIANRYHLYELR